LPAASQSAGGRLRVRNPVPARRFAGVGCGLSRARQTIKIKGFHKHHKVKLFPRVEVSTHRTGLGRHQRAHSGFFSGHTRRVRPALEDRAVSSRGQTTDRDRALPMPQSAHPAPITSPAPCWCGFVSLRSPGKPAVPSIRSNTRCSMTSSVSSSKIRPFE